MLTDCKGIIRGNQGKNMMKKNISVTLGVCLSLITSCSSSRNIPISNEQISNDLVAQKQLFVGSMEESSAFSSSGNMTGRVAKSIMLEEGTHCFKINNTMSAFGEEEGNLYLMLYNFDDFNSRSQAGYGQVYFKYKKKGNEWVATELLVSDYPEKFSLTTVKKGEETPLKDLIKPLCDNFTSK
jgi:hypothetical protein